MSPFKKNFCFSLWKVALMNCLSWAPLLHLLCQTRTLKKIGCFASFKIREEFFTGFRLFLPPRQPLFRPLKVVSQRPNKRLRASHPLKICQILIECIRSNLEDERYRPAKIHPRTTRRRICLTWKIEHEVRKLVGHPLPSVESLPLVGRMGVKSPPSFFNCPSTRRHIKNGIRPAWYTAVRDAREAG